MICIIDCGTSWLQEIKTNLISLGYEFKVIKLNEIKDANFESFSGIIISGSPTMLSQVNLKEYLQPFQFIKNIKLPILGICFGHQIIGLLNGSKVYTGRKIDKQVFIKVVKENELFKGINRKALLKEDHSEYISLPSNFTLLAESKYCSNEAMKHKNKEIYSVQFHPEVSKDNGKKLFKNFLNKC